MQWFVPVRKTRISGDGGQLPTSLTSREQCIQHLKECCSRIDEASRSRVCARMGSEKTERVLSYTKLNLLIGVQGRDVSVKEPDTRYPVDVSTARYKGDVGVEMDGEKFTGSEEVDNQRRNRFSGVSAKLFELFDELMDRAIRYKEVTRRFPPISGELRDQCARLGVTRTKVHGPGAEGANRIASRRLREQLGRASMRHEPFVGKIACRPPRLSRP